MLVRQPVFLDLARNQELFCNLAFFHCRVTRQAHDFHAVEQRSRNRIHDIRRGDEHDRTQIVIDFEIMVIECVVLLRVKHFEKRRSRIAPEVVSEFVELIQHENRVGTPCLFHSLDDASRQSPDIGSAVSADFRFVAHAAEGHSDEFPAHGFRD